MGALDTATRGLGDIRKLLLEQQAGKVAEVFGLKNRPSADGLYNLSMLPSKAERMVKA